MGAPPLNRAIRILDQTNINSREHAELVRALPAAIARLKLKAGPVLPPSSGSGALPKRGGYSE